MHQDVLDTSSRLLGEFDIQPDPARVCIATAPASLHLSDACLTDCDSDLTLPLVEKRRNLFAELAPVPFLNHDFTLLNRGPGSHKQLHCPVVRQMHKRWSVVLDDVQAIAIAKEEMAFATQVLALRLPLLLIEVSLLPADPSQS